MTNTATSAGVVGTVNALGAVLLQAATVSSPSMTLAVPLVSAVIGGVMSYAVLKTTVSKMERDVRDMRSDMGEMYTLLRDAMTKIAHMEGRLEHRS
jgi:hypothetical protein